MGGTKSRVGVWGLRGTAGELRAGPGASTGFGVWDVCSGNFRGDDIFTVRRQEVSVRVDPRPAVPCFLVLSSESGV